MRTVEFTEYDVCQSIYHDCGKLRDAGYEVHYAGPWEWEDGYVGRDVVIRHTETGMLFKGYVDLPLISVDEYELGRTEFSTVLFRETRETKIKVSHFE